MPPTAPNSLAGSQLTDLMSYILKANDIPRRNVALNLPISGGAAPAAASVPPRHRRVEDLRRRSGEHAVLAARPDQ